MILPKYLGVVADSAAPADAYLVPQLGFSCRAGVLVALREVIWHDFATKGLPKQDISAESVFEIPRADWLLAHPGRSLAFTT